MVVWILRDINDPSNFRTTVTSLYSFPARITNLISVEDIENIKSFLNSYDRDYPNEIYTYTLLGNILTVPNLANECMLHIQILGG